MTEQSAPISIGASAPVIHLRKLSPQERRELYRAIGDVAQEFNYRGSARHRVHEFIRARLGLSYLHDMRAVQLPTALALLSEVGRVARKYRESVYRTEQRFWVSLPEIMQ